MVDGIVFKKTRLSYGKDKTDLLTGIIFIGAMLLNTVAFILK